MQVAGCSRKKLLHLQGTALFLQSLPGATFWDIAVSCLLVTEHWCYVYAPQMILSLHFFYELVLCMTL